jgi:hypothetical protein
MFFYQPGLMLPPLFKLDPKKEIKRPTFNIKCLPEGSRGEGCGQNEELEVEW